MIRVLVAEDSVTTRAYLVHLLEQDPGIEVVGEAADGAEAVALTESLRPEVVLMDVEMPRLDGIEATRQIMERAPTPIVMVSAHSRHVEERAFEALATGALAVLGKPAGVGQADHAATAERLLSTVKLMAEVKVVRRWRSRDVPPAQPGRLNETSGIRVVAIGASAGGPPTVAEILSRLPSDLPCSVLLVQHIAPGFCQGLAAWLGRSTSLTVKLAEADEPTRPGTVYVAPDGAHLGLGEGRIRLVAEAEVDGFRPSASYLLQSVARAAGSRALGVLLTGMGRDGAVGLLALRRAGGITIAQDEESSVVFGMPREAIMIGAAAHVLPPKGIADAILSTVTAAPVDNTRR